MCGFAGYYSLFNSFSNNELESVGGSIASRGPDYQGVYSDERVGLVHRRLKIIDLSDDANQPMLSDDGRYVMVYKIGQKTSGKRTHQNVSYGGGTQLQAKLQY